MDRTCIKETVAIQGDGAGYGNLFRVTDCWAEGDASAFDHLQPKSKSMGAGFGEKLKVFQKLCEDARVWTEHWPRT